jgi:RNA polymerase sigma-70 factor (ECF subfamily)
MMELLDEPDREALRLVDAEGLGQKELAARLGLSITGAKSRVQRARRRLKEVLTDCCEIEMDRRGNAIGYTPRNCTSCGCD